MMVNTVTKSYKIFFMMIAAAVVFLFIPGGALGESIISSKHNLSFTGPGTVKASSESEVCIFCHTPHNASTEAPLWNRYQSGQTYTTYTSSTSRASIGQPTGASKLCLSCHDGTVALGMVRSRAQEIPFTSPIRGNNNLGSDLSDDHPVSLVYNTALTFMNPGLKNPSLLTGQVKLDASSQVQCTSCHDPHNNQYGDFLVVDGKNSNLCVQCHNVPSWAGSSHQESAQTFSGVFPKAGWETVADYGCQSCHTPHNAGGNARLLNYGAEEANCAVCHDGSVAQTNINSEFNKFSHHPIGDFTGVHDPSEAMLVSSPRHVECADCHNPHAVRDQDSVVPGSLNMVKGIDASGAEVSQIQNEYELCLRCHGDSAGGFPYVDRQYPEINTRFEFDSANASYHPVMSIGKNTDVPSLISPYTTSSIIQCSGCHNNNNGSGAMGIGPNGPHGSDFSPLLERRLTLQDNQSESLSTYALCYKCHDRNSILANQSFPYHRKHIVEERAACTACHDPHGVRNATHLINFDRNVVQPSGMGGMGGGQILFEDLGQFAGRCYLSCHGKNHNPETYGMGGMGGGMGM